MHVRKLEGDRLDIDVYNEACGFVVTSASLAGHSAEELDATNPDNWKRAIADVLREVAPIWIDLDV